MICKNTLSLFIVTILFSNSSLTASPKSPCSRKLGFVFSVLMTSKIPFINACEHPSKCETTSRKNNLRHLNRALYHKNVCGSEFTDGDLSYDWTPDSTQRKCFKSCGSFENDSHKGFGHGFFNPTSLDGDGDFYINGYAGTKGEITLIKEIDNLHSGELTFKYQYAYDLTSGKAHHERSFEVEIRLFAKPNIG